MRKLLATLAIIGCLTGPLHATERGPILESAARHAARMTLSRGQQTDCQAAARQGEQDGRARQGSGGWFAGGLLLTPFFVPIMPIVAHTSDPTPPADALSGISRNDMNCYTTGYVRVAKGKRVKAAWIGYGVSAGLWAALVSTLVASDGY